jgi:hypothetical protein
MGKYFLEFDMFFYFMGNFTASLMLAFSVETVCINFHFIPAFFDAQSDGPCLVLTSAKSAYKIFFFHPVTPSN